MPRGMNYGANQSDRELFRLITSDTDRITSGATTTLTGINLDRVATLEIGGTKIGSRSYRQAKAPKYGECRSVSPPQQATRSRFQPGQFRGISAESDGVAGITVSYFVYV